MVISKSPKSFTYQKRLYGKVGILSRLPLYRRASGNANKLYVLDGAGKNRKPLAVVKFL